MTDEKGLPDLPDAVFKRPPRKRRFIGLALESEVADKFDKLLVERNLNRNRVLVTWIVAYIKQAEEET